MSAKINHRILNGIELKLCYVCKQFKPLCCFNKCKNIWDGLDQRCKTCNKIYRQYNKEKIAISNKQYYKKHEKEIKIYAKQYLHKNKEKVKVYGRRWRKKNKGKSTIYNAQQYQENKKERAKYYQENKERITKREKQYCQENKDKRCIYQAQRRNLKIRATQVDVNLKAIKQLYTICNEVNNILGGSYFHVDHIQPLTKGGQHHEDNLQILEATLNLQKNNKWPLTPEEQIKYKGVKIK
jgi:hypothetical protein